MNRSQKELHFLNFDLILAFESLEMATLDILLTVFSAFLHCVVTAPRIVFHCGLMFHRLEEGGRPTQKPKPRDEGAITRGMKIAQDGMQAGTKIHGGISVLSLRSVSTWIYVLLGPLLHSKISWFSKSLKRIQKLRILGAKRYFKYIKNVKLFLENRFKF